MMRPRRGFTLVELLVVMALIGISFAILTPALQATREAGRRTACANNMFRLAMAINAYESAHECYPPGVTDTQGPILSRASGMHHGWTEVLLPYLDERVVYSKIDFAASVYDPKNATIRGLRLPELICPSDDVVDETPHSSYAACHHDAESRIDAGNNGVFFLNSRIRPADITDGLAYTLFVAEKQTEGDGKDLGWMSGTRATLRNTGTELDWTGPRALMSQSTMIGPVSQTPNRSAAVSDSPAPPPVADSPLNLPTSIQPSPANDGSSAALPRPRPKTPPIWELPNYVGGFGSDHGGGIVMAATGDGSVRRLTDLIDPGVLRLLGNRADGQLINPQDLDK